VSEISPSASGADSLGASSHPINGNRLYTSINLVKIKVRPFYRPLELGNNP